MDLQWIAYSLIWCYCLLGGHSGLLQMMAIVFGRTAHTPTMFCIHVFFWITLSSILRSLKRHSTVAANCVFVNSCQPINGFLIIHRNGRQAEKRQETAEEANCGKREEYLIRLIQMSKHDRVKVKADWSGTVTYWAPCLRWLLLPCPPNCAPLTRWARLLSLSSILNKDYPGRQIDYAVRHTVSASNKPPVVCTRSSGTLSSSPDRQFLTQYVLFSHSRHALKQTLDQYRFDCGLLLPNLQSFADLSVCGEGARVTAPDDCVQLMGGKCNQIQAAI